jgi:hypothetical protein
MSVQLLFPEELTREEIEALWDQNVNMDDWDFLVLDNPESLTQVPGWHNNRYKHNNYQLDIILYRSSPYKYTWYKAEFRGQLYAIGVAYHA